MVGDDIAWIKPDATGRLRAINPEAGFFGVAPGTSAEDQPERDGHDRAEHDLHERRAHAGRRRVVGRHDRRAARRVPRLARQAVDAGDRARHRANRRRIRTRDSPRRRHSARSSTRTGNRPRACRSAPSSSAGAARTTMPLVYQAFNWTSGVYIGATMGSETTAAAAGNVGNVAARSDGDAAVLRLSHGRLLPALDQDAARPQRDAQDLSRELVSQGRGGRLSLARLSREHARAQVDRRPRPRACADEGNADRLDAALRRHRLERAADFRGSSSTSCRQSIRRSGGGK